MITLILLLAVFLVIATIIFTVGLPIIFAIGDILVCLVILKLLFGRKKGKK